MAPSPYAAWADWISAQSLFDDFVARLSEDVSTRRDVVHSRQQRCLTFIGTFNIATEKPIASTVKSASPRCA